MMFRQRERRKVPGLNTTSTADISFMLLILFLVASSMDLDKGIARQLPPMEKEQKQQTAVDGRKVIRLAIDANNKVTMDGKNVSMIRQRTEQFVNTNGKSHLIQLQTDRKASYDTYLHVQNALVAAYNAVRNSKASDLFGKSFDLCSTEQQQQIADEVPIRVSAVSANKPTTTEKGGAE